jgi:hypothetical protein
LVNIIVYPDLYERERMHVRATPLLIVEGRLQRLKNNTNVLAMKVAPLEDAPFAYPRHYSDSREDPITDAADPRTIQLVHLETRGQPTDGPRHRADITAIAPDSHNYR